jgi:hypothetical protein
LRLGRNNAFGVQLLRDLLEAVPAGVHGEDSLNNGCLILAHFKSDAGYQCPPVLVDTCWVFDRHIAISEAPSTSVQATQRLALYSAVDFSSKFFEIKTVDDPVCGKQHLGLFGISVDTLAHENQADTRAAQFIVNREGIFERAAYSRSVIDKNDVKGLPALVAAASICRKPHRSSVAPEIASSHIDARIEH